MDIPESVGKRRDTLVALTIDQRKLIEQCQAKGLSKQLAITMGLQKVTDAQLEEIIKSRPEYGEGDRKKVKIRLGENVWKDLQELQSRIGKTLKCSYADIIHASLEAAKDL